MYKQMKQAVKIMQIYDYIDEIAPFDKALSYDNVGLLVGDKNSEVNRILLSLDITYEVIEEAVAEKAQLIFSHHPVLFEPIKSVNENDKVYKLIKNNIAALCAHTNLDIAEDGLNDILFNMLELQEMKWLSFDNSQAIGRWGILPKQTTVKEFAFKVKELLGSNVVRYVEGSHYVKNVAVITGAGGSDYKTALLCGADTLITGDAKYHSFIDAYELGFNIIEAGHFSTENIILPVIKKKLENKFPGIEVAISKKHRNIINVI